MRYDVYTDGACSVNKRLGGYAAIALYDGQQIVLHGNKKNATNNEMEILAAINILHVLVTMIKPEDLVVIHSDSAYLVNAVNQRWIYSWIGNKWKTQDGKEVKNKSLWLKLFWLLNSVSRQCAEYQFIKVKGHSNCKLNNYVDRLAVKETELLKGKQLED